MGLFVQRPEEPADWAGIPSEPAHPEGAAERLTDAAGVDPGLLVGGELGGGAVESIVIPVVPAIEIAQPQKFPADE
ncbi:hypothetical protein [Microbacterium sp. CPCC 204701]|uniref:hypothetical protein n=1 Tax=Microbacterium sp. CPCC 204701 TaxID=2493084 RepID=UPI000FD9CBC9|nr:hypothetical protein [Microbacterium sp. CPCC 204701]